MISRERDELLRILAELSEFAPEVRLGQLVANLSYMARGLSTEAIWDMEDEEFLEAAKAHLAEWMARREALAK
jgi:hypothetical protein